MKDLMYQDANDDIIETMIIEEVVEETIEVIGTITTEETIEVVTIEEFIEYCDE